MSQHQQGKRDNKLTTKIYSWWQKNKRLLAIVAVIIVVLLVIFTLAVVWFGWDWTGFTSMTGPTLQPNEQYRPAKTLWDVLQLLIIPTVLVVAGFLLSQIQKDRDQKAGEAQKLREEESREDNQREAAVQEYIDKMSELLLREHLHGPQPSDEARKIARIRTLTVLHRLDGKRKRIVLQFLHESGLIDKNNRIVELHGADFRQAVLSWLHLENAHLGGAFCWEVDFSDAFLYGVYLGGAEFKEVIWNRADLGEAYFKEARFLDADGNRYTSNIAIEEQLKEAKSLQGAIMPDGSKHP